MKNVLYIHGMGGGGDSRIPSILSECLTSPSSCYPDRSGGPISVICRTYDFDPEIASVQISEWVDELKPCLIIGESLGSLHAIRVKGVPHIFVSPALNTPFYFEVLAWLSLVPGVSYIFDRIYRPKDGDRQRLHFTHGTLRKYLAHRKEALNNSTASGSKDMFFAFFGTEDHYRRSGVVSVRTWKKHFGNTYYIYKGTHFMEEEYVRTLLVDKVCELLNVS